MAKLTPKQQADLLEAEAKRLGEEAEARSVQEAVRVEPLTFPKVDFKERDDLRAELEERRRSQESQQS